MMGQKCSGTELADTTMTRVPDSFRQFEYQSERDESIEGRRKLFHHF